MAATIRVLSAGDVAALLPTPAEMLALVEAALRRIGAGESAGALAGGATWVPGFDAAAHPSLRAMAGGAGASAGATAGAIAGARGGSGGGAPALAALLEPGGQRPLLVLDREPLAVAREAACTAVAARLLAAPGADVIAIVGCNERGRAVMASLIAALPGLERLLCYDPDVEAQARFADEIMTTHSIASVIPPEPQECVEGGHVVVSCLRPALAAPVVERKWLQSGTLCVSLDVDNTFTPAMLAAADRRVTDSLPAWRDCAAAGHFPGVAAPDAELAAIVAGKAPGRSPAGKPVVALMMVGQPALDGALAAELLRRAEAGNRGQALPA